MTSTTPACLECGKSPMLRRTVTQGQRRGKEVWRCPDLLCPGLINIEAEDDDVPAPVTGESVRRISSANVPLTRSTSGSLPLSERQSASSLPLWPTSSSCRLAEHFGRLLAPVTDVTDGTIISTSGGQLIDEC
jgi:hypothetical protein